MKPRSGQNHDNKIAPQVNFNPTGTNIMDILCIFVIPEQYFFQRVSNYFQQQELFLFYLQEYFFHSCHELFFGGTSNYFSNVYQELIINWADNYFSRYIIFYFILFYFWVENCSIAQTCHAQ